MLPGDEIVEKKHANIKTLTAQKESTDLSKKAMKKWPGLGTNPFDVDYGTLFESYKEFARPQDESSGAAAQAPPAQPPAKGGKGG